MINYSLPTTVIIDGEEYRINKNGDYRVILDIISILNDSELSQTDKCYCVLCVFFGYDKEKKAFIIPKNANEAIKEIFKFINCGEEENNVKPQPKLMDWEQDFNLIIPPINKVWGFEVRSVDYLHWWSFIGAYMEISGDCVFSQVKDIRQKRSKGIKLEKHEQRFFNDNKDLILLKNNLSKEDRSWLDEID